MHPETERQSPLWTCLEAILKELDGLKTALSQLTVRLAPVRVETPADQVVAEDDRESRSPLFEQLESIRHATQLRRVTVEELLEEITI